MIKLISLIILAASLAHAQQEPSYKLAPIPEMPKTCEDLSVKEKIKANCNLDEKYLGSGKTALIQAVEIGDKDGVRTLLTKGVNIEAKETFGDTALMKAIHEGNTDIFVMLVSAGASLTAKDSANNDAFEIAKQRGRKDMELVILSKIEDSVCDFSYDQIAEYAHEAQRMNARIPHDADFEKLKTILIKYSNEDIYDRSCVQGEDVDKPKKLLQRRTGKASDKPKKRFKTSQ